MNNTSFSRNALLLFPFLFSFCFLIAQQPGYLEPSVTQLTVAIDKVLKENLVGALPHHHCYCNNCKHTYSGNLKLIKKKHTMRITPMLNGQEKKEEVLRVWGRAGAEQRTQFLGSNAVIFFIADLMEFPSGLEIVSLQWKLDDCMKYKLLLGGEDELVAQYTEEDVQEAEVAEVDPAVARIAEQPVTRSAPEEEASLEEFGNLEDIVDLGGNPFMEELPAPDPAWAAQDNEVMPDEADPFLTPKSVELPGFALDLTLTSQMVKSSLSKKEINKGLKPEITIQGVITNLSREIKYKDAILEISFYTKTKTLLATEKHTLYEFFEPDGKQKFSYPVQPPEATMLHKVKLLKAVEAE